MVTIKELTAQDFDQSVASGFTVVDFWATWCGPCKRMHGILDAVASQFAEKVKFFKLNIDEFPDIAGRWQIMSIPTLIFLKDGVEVERKIGAMDESALVSILNLHNLG